MGLLDAISDFMGGSRRKAKGRSRRSGGKHVHAKLVGQMMRKHPGMSLGAASKAVARGRRGGAGHADSARYFQKQPRKGSGRRKGPYFKQGGKDSPFHACVSQKMYAGASLPVASRACSRQRSAAMKGRYVKPAKHHKKRAKSGKRASHKRAHKSHKRHRADGA